MELFLISSSFDKKLILIHHEKLLKHFFPFKCPLICARNNFEYVMMMWDWGVRLKPIRKQSGGDFKRIKRRIYVVTLKTKSLKVSIIKRFNNYENDVKCDHQWLLVFNSIMLHAQHANLSTRLNAVCELLQLDL